MFLFEVTQYTDSKTTTDNYVELDVIRLNRVLKFEPSGYQETKLVDVVKLVYAV